MAIDTLNYSNMITCNEITGEITAHKRKYFFERYLWSINPACNQTYNYGT